MRVKRKLIPLALRSLPFSPCDQSWCSKLLYVSTLDSLIQARLPQIKSPVYLDIPYSGAKMWDEREGQAWRMEPPHFKGVYELRTAFVM